jgi:hypothetical protein
MFLFYILYISKNYLKKKIKRLKMEFTLEGNYDAEIIVGMKEILKVLIPKKYFLSISGIQVIEREGYTNFSPYLEISNENTNRNGNTNEINLKELVGYTLLSDSPLTKYAIKKSGKEIEVKYIDGIAIIPLKIPNSYEEEIGEIGEIYEDINSLVSKGYFTYSLGTFDLDDIPVFSDLCKLFNIKVIDDSDPSNIILQTDVDFYTSPQEWLRNNLPIVKFGQFPIFTLNDFPLEGDYQKLYGEVFRNLILKYAAYLSFAELSDEERLITPFIFFITVNDDLSVSVPLPSYKCVKKFRKIMKRTLKGPLSILNCLDFQDGILQRYKVQKVDPDAYPMILSDGKKEYLLHRSPFYDFQERDVERGNLRDDLSLEKREKLGEKEKEVLREEKLKEELLREMRNFHSKCHDNYEAVTLENINEMNLDELLNLISIEENGKNFCFSKETISKVENNPLTRSPLTEKTIMKMKYLDFGLRGVFDIGVLYGLYPEVPTKVRIPVKVGTPKITRIPTNEKERQLIGNLFSVEIVFPDDFSLEIFEISLPLIELDRIDKLREAVDKLWEKGYFLSYWTSAVVHYLSPPSFSIIPIDLSFAKDSIFDGNKALELLSGV